MKKKKSKKWKKYTKEKEPPRCNMQQVQRYRSSRDSFLDSVVLPFVKSRNDIIYGSRAMNIQLPPQYRRKSDDYDIWGLNPARSCDHLEDRLDRKIGCDMFVEEKKFMPKIQKTVYRIRAKHTDKQEVDYTKKPKEKVKTVKIKGVTYQHIDHQYQRLKEMSKDPNLAFRLEKTTKDLRTIEKAKGKPSSGLIPHNNMIW